MVYIDLRQWNLPVAAARGAGSSERAGAGGRWGEPGRGRGSDFRGGGQSAGTVERRAPARVGRRRRAWGRLRLSRR